MFKKTTIALLAALLLCSGIYADDKDVIPVARLVYFENPARDMIIRGRDGSVITFDFGTTLNPGTKIFTGSGFAELQLEPNGTIIKLSSGTTFELTALQGRGGSDTNIFTLYAGKIRTVAARVFGRDDRYQVKTSTAVCGVRGTDFINDLTPGAGAIFCREGVVEVTSPAGRKVTITAAQKVLTTGGVFKTETMTLGDVENVFRSMDFVRLNPQAVPRIDNNPPKTEDTPAADDKTVKSDTGTGDASDTDPADSKEQTGQEQSTAEEKGDSRQTDIPADIPGSDLVDNSIDGTTTGTRTGSSWLTDLLGFEIGTITVDNATWSQAVLQPAFNFDRIKFGLYLPVIYTDNLFDPSEWYHPDGNNEWSFGSDQEGDAWRIFEDINRDLWLKIRYFEAGDQLVDPFFIKFGNLSSMTLGHGALVRDYANDTDFPGVRRIGLNTGARLGPVGLEFLGDDMSELQLVGGRFAFSPIPSASSFRIGLSGAADLKWAENLPDPGFVGDPWLLAMALDVEFLQINSGIFRMVAYADAGTYLPVFRNKPSDLLFSKVESGAAWDNIARDGVLRNFGINAGVQGSVSVFRYLLEFRYENQFYRTGMMDSTWERMKQEQLLAVLFDLQEPIDPFHTIGIYGKGGFELFNEKMIFAVSYYWPWTLSDGTVEVGETDYFKAEFIVARGLVPRIGIHGSISYERQKFSGMFKDEDLVFLDGNAVLKGELVVPLTPVVDLAFVLSTVTKYDDAGHVIYRPDGVTPEISPVINLETRIHF